MELVDKNRVRDTYLRQGAVWPLPAFTESEITYYREQVLIERAKGLMSSDYRCKSQVLFPWMADIAMSPSIKHYVSAILGDNFHCWDTLFWIKEPKDNKVVSTHQDATYWNFTPKDKALTVWLAFNDVTVQSGAIRYSLGSHVEGQNYHNDIRSNNNLLMRGQTIDNEQTLVNSYQTAYAELAAGQITMHSPFTIHGSAANESYEPRLACGMVFAAAEVKPIATYAQESTLWVSGVDNYGYMLHDPKPTNDALVNEQTWKQAYDRQHENYYRMQQVTEERLR